MARRRHWLPEQPKTDLAGELGEEDFPECVLISLVVIAMVPTSSLPLQ